MPQKYKVFIDSTYILFTDVNQFLPNWPHLSPQTHEELVSLLQHTNYQVVSPDPEQAMFSFFSNWKSLQTAGGLVQRENDDAFLWIYRFAHLDLPKGKIEKGEGKVQAAIREIEEETGLDGQFELLDSLPCTYHVYALKGRSFFKQNYWFRFRFSGVSALTPQKEEGIESVFWLSDAQWRSRLAETYPGLQELLAASC
jgi:8-oxo-dGTP pyrophosphatase MutT (NUDIX family)